MAKKVTREALENQIKNMLTTDKRLNLQKMCKGKNGSSYYRDMEGWFLNDMESMTGEKNGFERDDQYYMFQLTPPPPATISFLLIPFNIITGRFAQQHTGIYFTSFVNRVNASAAEIEKAPGEAKAAFDKFVAEAERLGYLLPTAGA